MDNAVFINPTKIIFGKGTESEIGREAAKYSEQVLLLYGGKSAEESGLLDRVRKSLKDEGIIITELGGVQPNPRLSLVREGIHACKAAGIGAVVAVGGGSVLDTAKAIACGAPNADDVWDYFKNEKAPETILPVLTILTIPGAGSESSNGMVITNEETGEKIDYCDDRARPVVSVLNPELTTTVPPFYSATGIADAMVHIFERYFTNTKNVEVSDRYNEGLLINLIENGKAVIENPEDYNVRAEIMWACKLAHDGTGGVGREEDWGVHMIEHEVSAVYDVAHAAGLTAILPHWMRYVYKNDVDRFAQFAVRVMGVPESGDKEKDALAGIDALSDYFKSIGMPVTLAELGVPDKSRLDEIAKSCADHGERFGERTVGHFVKLGEKEIREILENAYGQ